MGAAVDLIDPGVSRKTQAGVAIGAGVLILIVLAVVAYLVVKLFKSGKELLDPLVEGAKAVTQAVGSTAAVGAGLASGAGGSNLNQDAKDFDERRDQLRIEVLRKKDTTPGASKRTEVDLKVVNARTGQGVPYAVLKGRFSFNATQTAQGRNVRRLVANAQGLYTNLYWTVLNVPGTDKEDDLVFVAEKTGFNPSSPVTLG